MIEAGKILQDRYRVQRQIGQGGMGAVYIATDERFGSTVAVKETLVLEEQYRKAIEREARLLNSLKHPALPRVTDHFTDDDGQFIVMEFIPGSDLSEMIEQNGRPFPADQVLDWADQLLDALDFLHMQEMPVIHRDIKPQNLKLTPQGRIILLDFGLAKGNPTDAEHQTAAKSIFGYSRSYASLEQIQGTGTDPRSDLYSLAATLYHLLTGTPPEDALTRAMYVLGDNKDILKPVNEIILEIPAGLANILQKSLALSANQRPDSARELRRMLHESEKYADVSHLQTIIDNPLQTAGKVRQTSALSQAFKKQSDVRTEVLPAVQPERRQIKIPVGATQPPWIRTAAKTYTDDSNRRFPAAAIAGGGLLLVLLALGTVYILSPSIFGNRQSQSFASENTVFNSNSSPNSNTGNANSDTGNAPANSMVVTVSNSNAVTAVENSPVLKTGETAKAGDINSNSTQIPIEVPTPKSAKTIGKTESEAASAGTPVPVAVRTENPAQRNSDDGRQPNSPPPGERPPPPNGGQSFPPGEGPPLSPEQFRRLPPQEQQRIREMLQRRGERPPG